MLDAIGLEKLTDNCDSILKDYHDCFKLITCKTPSEACFLNKCKSCPKLDARKEYLTKSFDENCIKEVIFPS